MSYDYVNIKIPETSENHFPDFPQVKCWDCGLRCYEMGDIVPSVQNHPTYSIELRYGGYLNINTNILVSFTEEPQFSAVFNKWGYPT
jgi:hypothetical protein